MALSEPRSLVQLMDTLPIISASWRPRMSRQIDGQASGQILQAQVAPDLWEMDIRLAIATHDEARKIRARLNSLLPVGRFFLAYDPIAQYPAYDPTGSILGSSTVTINAIGANRDTLRLDDLPGNYQLREGDKIELGYSGRRQLVEVSEQVTATSGGLSPVFAVYPHIRPGVTTSATVNLKQPSLKMMVLPSSFSPGTSVSVFHDGMGLTAIEKVV